jgi:hypothetical protein
VFSAVNHLSYETIMFILNLIMMIIINICTYMHVCYVWYAVETGHFLNSVYDFYFVTIGGR